MANKRVRRTRSFSSYIAAVNHDVKTLKNQPAPAIADGSITGASLSNELILSTSILQSENYQEGLAGWRISGSGNAEFANVLVRGDINAESGSIGNWNISSGGVERVIGGETLFGTYLESEDLGDSDDGKTSGLYVGLFKVAPKDTVPITGRSLTNNIATIHIPGHTFEVNDYVYVDIDDDTIFSTGNVAVQVIETSDDYIKYSILGTSADILYETDEDEYFGLVSQSLLDIAGLYIQDYGRAYLDYGYFSSQGVKYVAASSLNLINNPSFEYKQFNTATYSPISSTSGWSTSVTGTTNIAIATKQLTTITPPLQSSSEYGLAVTWSGDKNDYVVATVDWEVTKKFGIVSGRKSLYLNFDVFANYNNKYLYLGDTYSEWNFTGSGLYTSVPGIEYTQGDNYIYVTVPSGHTFEAGDPIVFNKFFALYGSSDYLTAQYDSNGTFPQWDDGVADWLNFGSLPLTDIMFVESVSGNTLVINNGREFGGSYHCVQYMAVNGYREDSFFADLPNSLDNDPTKPWGLVTSDYVNLGGLVIKRVDNIAYITLPQQPERYSDYKIFSKGDKIAISIEQDTSFDILNDVILDTTGADNRTISWTSPGPDVEFTLEPDREVSASYIAHYGLLARQGANVAMDLSEIKIQFGSSTSNRVSIEDLMVYNFTSKPDQKYKVSSNIYRNDIPLMMWDSVNGVHRESPGLELDPVKIDAKYQELSPDEYAAEVPIYVVFPGWLYRMSGVPNGQASLNPAWVSAVGSKTNVKSTSGYIIDNVYLSTEDDFFFGASSNEDFYSWYGLEAAEEVTDPNTASVKSGKRWIDVDLSTQTSYLRVDSLVVDEESYGLFNNANVSVADLSIDPIQRTQPYYSTWSAVFSGPEYSYGTDDNQIHSYVKPYVGTYTTNGSSGIELVARKHLYDYSGSSTVTTKDNNYISLWYDARSSLGEVVISSDSVVINTDSFSLSSNTNQPIFDLNYSTKTYQGTDKPINDVVSSIATRYHAVYFNYSYTKAFTDTAYANFFTGVYPDDYRLTDDSCYVYFKTGPTGAAQISFGTEGYGTNSTNTLTTSFEIWKYSGVYTDSHASLPATPVVAADDSRSVILAGNVATSNSGFWIFNGLANTSYVLVHAVKTNSDTATVSRRSLSVTPIA